MKQKVKIAPASWQKEIRRFSPVYLAVIVDWLPGKLGQACWLKVFGKLCPVIMVVSDLCPENTAKIIVHECMHFQLEPKAIPIIEKRAGGLDFYRRSDVEVPKALPEETINQKADHYYQPALEWATFMIPYAEDLVQDILSRVSEFPGRDHKSF